MQLVNVNTLITNHDFYTFARECVLLLRPYADIIARLRV
jgi:hypothetical protein